MTVRREKSVLKCEPDMGSSQYHVVLFPFMSKGHTIPLLHLGRLLLRHRPTVSITIFTTPANHSFISSFVSADTAKNVSTITLSFPQNIHPDIPPGAESTDKLPTMALFPLFSLVTENMQQEFETAIGSLPPVNFMVSDGFLWWTLEASKKFGFPRLVFYGMNIYSSVMNKTIFHDRVLEEVESADEPVPLTTFPWIKVTRNDFDPGFWNPEFKNGPHFDFMIKCFVSTTNSYGMIFNTFYDLEHVFADYDNKDDSLKSWIVGPLCLADDDDQSPEQNDHPDEKKPSWIEWLDEKAEEGKSVLYVAFGSQAEITEDQLKEILIGLDESKVNFLWVTRAEIPEIGDVGFEEKVRGRGILVREWVDQKEILAHKSVTGFLSHCGWNSALEGICAGVPILAWPMMAEQHLNAKMVVEEIKVGLRVEMLNGSVRAFVKWEGLEKMVKELMEGEMGEEVRKNVKDYAELAKKAMEAGTGSSWKALEMLIEEMEIKS